ncbi:MAG TPA: Xaa-Pro peptidase family protein [Deltaproteobacteria bacterium]|nr:Xaa-Pro peptidase family protein [Deltaproteobacteria bacterium]
MHSRLDRLRQACAGTDAVLLTGRVNIAYLSGFTGTEGLLLVTPGDAILCVDSRYTVQAGRETALEVREITRRWEDVYALIKDLGIRSLGLDSNVMDYDTYEQVRKLCEGVEIVPVGPKLKDLRLIKDADEIERLRTAAAVAEEALRAVLEKGIVGRRERDVALDIEWQMRTRGASAVSFELIVAAGERSAMPHGVASDALIPANAPVVIDFGCIVEGYCSDQTVTVTTGNVSDEFEAAYARVFEAQQKAIAALAPGTAAAQVDRLARGHLNEYGLGAFFGHGLGHGVGREVHEPPSVSSRSEDVLSPGMVITIEPGVYFPGRFGIRLEDCFVITDISCQALTNMAKGAIISFN